MHKARTKFEHWCMWCSEIEQLKQDFVEKIFTFEQNKRYFETLAAVVHSLTAFCRYNDLRDSQLCVICQDGEKSVCDWRMLLVGIIWICYLQVVLLPCRHRCVCHACEDGLVECPMCRSVIQSKLHVYWVLLLDVTPNKKRKTRMNYADVYTNLVWSLVCCMLHISMFLVYTTSPQAKEHVFSSCSFI